jgi:hypothetical protein
MQVPPRFHALAIARSTLIRICKQTVFSTLIRISTTKCPTQEKPIGLWEHVSPPTVSFHCCGKQNISTSIFTQFVQIILKDKMFT